MSTVHAETAAAVETGHGHGRDHVPHVLPLKAYLGVFAALLVLTATTVGISYFDFGTWNIVVAMAVASVKALLVAAIFMHLAFDKRFNAIVFLVSALFLMALIGLTLADTQYRGLADPIEGERPRDSAAPFANSKPDTQSEAKLRPANAATPAKQPEPAGAVPPAGK